MLDKITEKIPKTGNETADEVIELGLMLLAIFLFLKFLGFLVGSPIIPLTSVVSGSMEHSGMSFDSWWQEQGSWYETQVDITKEQFSKFTLRDGFNTGDAVFVVGAADVQIGDIVIYEHPSYGQVIHRIVEIQNSGNSTCYVTKGDHNNGVDGCWQKDLILAKTKFSIPLVGWPKKIAIDLWDFIF